MSNGCATSEITEYYNTTITNATSTITYGQWWVPFPKPTIYNYYYPRGAVEIFEDLLRIAKELDRELGLPDCEKSSEWVDELRKKVRTWEIRRLDSRLKGASR